MALVHVLGWRENVSVIAATSGIASKVILVEGAVYLVVYFAMVFTE